MNDAVTSAHVYMVDIAQMDEGYGHMYTDIVEGSKELAALPSEASESFQKQKQHQPWASLVDHVHWTDNA